ncbi:MAG TPA: class II aldolase/adducin family protein [Fimbriimonas sp.]
MSELSLRAEVCEIGRRLWQRGLIGAAEGNISVRLSPQRILCTPSGLSKGHLRPADLVVIDAKGNPVDGGAPSSEIKLHVRILARRPDCQAVIHAHPPIATGFALAEETIPDNMLPESAVVLGSVATVPFTMPGTDEVPDAIDPLLDDHKTFLMSHHGAVVMGRDLTDAYNRMETLERIATILLSARLVGTPQPMPDRAFDAMIAQALHGRLG